MMIRNEDEMRLDQLNPQKDLEELVDSYWAYQNPTNQVRKMIILPDSFLK